MIDPEKLPLTQTELEGYADMQAEWAASCITDEPRKTFDPVLSVFLYQPTPEGSEPLGDKMIVMNMRGGFTSDEGIRLAMFTAGRRLYQNKELIRGAILTTEAWSANMQPEEVEAGERPMNKPDRSEIILVSAESVGGRLTTGRNVELTRDAEGVFKAGAVERMEHPTGGPLQHLWRGYLFETTGGYRTEESGQFRGKSGRTG